ncbi:UNVERIFIED_CONTAM: hypothetical protein FKN15_065778 [Acipenser sinensis]
MANDVAAAAACKAVVDLCEDDRTHLDWVSQNQVGQHFTFVLTDIDSKQRFGFCRLTSGCKNEQLVFASGQALKDQQSQLPHSYFITPDINGLPTIPESRNLTEYFVAVDVNNMLQLYASMMHERRIIITSSKLSTLTACVHGSTALLYPLFWQHIYIPVLPPQLLDYCCAPMPYVVGVHLSLLEISTLKSKLKKQSTATGSGVAMAFLRTQAALFGSYRDALRYKPGEPISFCEDSFINHRSSTMRAFLKMAVNLQLFKQFIDGRLARINAGRGFSDVFEEEITMGGFCGANSRSYQQWMQPVKKGGAMINTAVTKASPAVKTAYKFETDEDGQLSMGSVSSTKTLSPKRKQGQKQRKFRRPNTSMGCADFALDDDDEMDTASKLSSEDSGEVSACIDNSDDSCEIDSDKQYTGKMDLLGEILDTLSINSSDQGKLSGAKSLDFFRSMDDIDYKVCSALGIQCLTHLDARRSVHAPRRSTLRRFDAWCTYIDAQCFGARRIDASTLGAQTSTLDTSALRRSEHALRCSMLGASTPRSSVHTPRRSTLRCFDARSTHFDAWRIDASTLGAQTSTLDTSALRRSEHALRRSTLGAGTSTLDAWRIDAPKLGAHTLTLDASALDAWRIDASTLGTRTSTLDARCTHLDARHFSASTLGARTSTLDTLAFRHSVHAPRRSTLGTHRSVLDARTPVLDVGARHLGV